ncbi:MAG: hypothetical protein ACW97W_17495 [Candidatus Hodarchaeales archaeon]
MTIPDKTKPYIRKELRAKGRSGLEEVAIKEKYLHHLKDSGKCEVKEMFGANWERFKLVDENNEENWEFLFYDKKGLEPETRRNREAKARNKVYKEIIPLCPSKSTRENPRWKQFLRGFVFSLKSVELQNSV